MVERKTMITKRDLLSWDKVHPERTLQAAFSRVAANQGAAGVDHVTISKFETRLDEELNPLDHLMAQQGFEMIRYADDFVIMCRSPEEAARALAVVQEWTASAGLTLHPTKTRIIDAREDAFEFLGYRIESCKRFPRAKSLTKLTVRPEGCLMRRCPGQRRELEWL